MVFNATFNNISVILWRLVLLMEVTGVPRENHWPTASDWQILSHNVVLSTPRLSGIRLTTLVVIGTDCIGSCRSNYHTIMNTTAALSEIIFQWNQMYEKMFEDTKDVNRRRDNTITKRQTMIYKALDRKRLSNTTSTEIWGWKLLR
jgi:hypothetical protein